MNDREPTKNEWALFPGFFLEAAADVPKNRTAMLFSLLSVIFGTDMLSLFDAGMPLETLSKNASSLFNNNPELFLILFPISLLSVYFGCALVISLADSDAAIWKSARKAFTASRTIYLLEAGFLSVATALGIILIIPYLLTGGQGPIAVSLLLSGALIYTVILTILFYSKTFSYFHILLSNVSLRAGIDLGYDLFRSRVVTSLIFGIVALLVNASLSYVMAVTLEPVMTLLPYSFAKTGVVSIVLIGIFSYVNAVNRSAWLTFFKYVASEPRAKENPEASQEEEKMIQREIPGTGQA